jgi:hypothetical protein
MIDPALASILRRTIGLSGFDFVLEPGAVNSLPNRRVSSPRKLKVVPLKSWKATLA